VHHIDTEAEGGVKGPSLIFLLNNETVLEDIKI
jgi:hypothetical protein